MARITDSVYPVLSSPASDDIVPVVDVSDTTMSSAGTTKQTTVADLLAGGGGAPLASPAFTGNPTAPTQATGDASTKLATDAFVAATTAYYLRVFAV